VVRFKPEDIMSMKWFAIGLGLGAVVAVVSAPRRGAETRQMLQDKADDARRFAAGVIQEAGEKVHDAMNEGQKKAEAVSGAAAAAADKFSEAS
jgi:gas vesicle protein